MQINSTKYGYSRLTNLFRKGINYSQYNKAVPSAVRPVVGNLPKDLLNLIIKSNPYNKRDAIIEVQNAYIKACNILSERTKLIQQAALRLQITEENIISIMFGLERQDESVYADKIFNINNKQIIENAQRTLLQYLKRVIPSIDNIKLSFIESGTYSDVFKCEVLDKEGKKIISDKVLKCFHDDADPSIDIDKKCAHFLQNHSTEEIIKNSRKSGQEINFEEFDKVKQNLLNYIHSMSKNHLTVSNYTSKMHGAYAEANISEYIRYMSGHKLSYKDGIVLPDMYVLSDKPFAISTYVNSSMRANRLFDFKRLGLYHSDANNNKNFINGICVDIGGIMPIVDKMKIQSLADSRQNNTALPLAKIYQYIEQARQSIIIGDKAATKFLKHFKDNYMPKMDKETFLSNIVYADIFKDRKQPVIEEIINKQIV